MNRPPADSAETAAPPVHVPALATGLERLVLVYDRIRRSALREARLTPELVYLLRLSAQPDGVRLRQFRQELGITDPRASQLARELVAKKLVMKGQDCADARARLVQATEKGRKVLAKFDMLTKLAGMTPCTGEVVPKA